MLNSRSEVSVGPTATTLGSWLSCAIDQLELTLRDNMGSGTWSFSQRNADIPQSGYLPDALPIGLE